MMSYWEYCEVGWTPKQITIHVYSQSSDGSYEGIQESKEWGRLLAQLGADGWELVGVVPIRPATHTLYYFKRPLDPPEVVELEKQVKLKAEQEWQKQVQERQKQVQEWQKQGQKQKQERQKQKQEREEATPEAILRVHRAMLMKSTPPELEPTEQPTDQERKRVMKGQEDPDQIAHADSSSATKHKPEP
jgi:hypothetical protein